MKKRMRISRIWKIGVVLALLVSGLSYIAQEVKAETPAEFFEFDSTTGTITKYIGTDTDVIIPSVIDTKAVTTIGNAAFQRNTTLNTVTIPSTVTTIEDGSTSNGAFFNCRALTKVTILGPVTRIAENAFLNCMQLTTINNGTAITSVGDSGLSYCSKLTTINLGKLTSIGSQAFFDCKVLTRQIELATNITSIPDFAFTNCYELTTINNGTPITSVGDSGLNNCKKLTTINLGELTSIGSSAFLNCTSLPKEKIKFADSLTSIKSNVFFGVTQLTEITLPNSLKTIGWNAFKGCSLPYITLPDSVELVESYAFDNQKSTGVYTVKNGVSTYTFPATIDVSKVTTPMTGVTIDSTNRTATSAGALDSFEYIYTATNSKNVSAPVTVTMTLTKSTLVDAENPTITNDLSTGEVKVVKDAKASPLNATATVSDGGDVTYQWYSNTTSTTAGGTEISGATNATYIPSTDTVGTTYYYCVVTNNNTSATGDKLATTTSNVAMITVEAKVDAVAPIITTDLNEAEVKVVKGTDAAALDATATVRDNGTISYQWYRSTTNNVGDGAIIDGATSATYTPPTNTLGTMHYYCVVTNTNANAPGTKTAKTTSRIAMITVTKKAPTMIEGQDQATYKGEEEELLFVSSADFIDFMEIQVDNQKIDASCYDAKAGSIRITLKPEYLKTLAVGEHVLSIVATSGDVDTTFVIKARDTKPQDPIIKPEEPSKPSDITNPTTPTVTKKEVIDTSDTTMSMTGLFSMLVLGGVTMLGLRKKNNFE